MKAAEELSQDKLQEYEDIFAFFDLDGNGSIDTDEFEQVCSRTIGFIGHYYYLLLSGHENIWLEPKGRRNKGWIFFSFHAIRWLLKDVLGIFVFPGDGDCYWAGW